MLLLRINEWCTQLDASVPDIFPEHCIIVYLIFEILREFAAVIRVAIFVHPCTVGVRLLQRQSV